MAEPNGNRIGQVDLSAAVPNGGMGECTVPQPRALADAGTRPAALSHCSTDLCNCS